MKKPLVIFLHFGYWLIYLLLLAVIFAIANLQIRKSADWQTIFPLAAICVVPNLVAFYGFYFALFESFLAKKKYAALVFAGVFVCVTAAICGDLISSLIFGFRQPIFTDAREFFALFSMFFTIAAIHGAVALVIKGFVRWFDEIRLKEELARRNFETEIALLKSQINPHFLFNTINNIDVLISQDKEKASEYLNKLSDILRYMVYETRHEKISLATELDYIEKYLELQKIRTTNADYINFETSGDAKNRKIAPMILFPFIENAFKHTENRKNANRIKITTLIEKERIVFICENSYQKTNSEKQDFGGIGNDLIKKRLELLYPEKHALEMTDSGEIYAVKLTLYEN